MEVQDSGDERTSTSLMVFARVDLGALEPSRYRYVDREERSFFYQDAGAASCTAELVMRTPVCGRYSKVAYVALSLDPPFVPQSYPASRYVCA